MKRSFVVTHTIRQSEITAMLDCPVTNAPSVKTLYPQKNCSFSYFRKNIVCLSVGLLAEVKFSASYNTVFRRIMTGGWVFHARHIETLWYGELLID